MLEQVSEKAAFAGTNLCAWPSEGQGWGQAVTVNIIDLSGKQNTVSKICHVTFFSKILEDLITVWINYKSWS